MSELIVVGILLAALTGGLLAMAQRVSELLVRSKARGLPPILSERMREEWLAELNALPGPISQLAFAIALALTRRHSFAVDDEGLFAASARAPITFLTSGDWRSVVLLTTILAAALAYAGSFLITPLYQSHARLVVTPQRLPSHFVEPAVALSLDQRLRSVSSNVFSRTRLEAMIVEFDLYRSDRGLLTSRRGASQAADLPTLNRPSVDEAVIDRMRKDIDVHVDPNGQSLEIAYVSPDPRTAMKVNERLMTLFIEVSLRNGEAASEKAGEFLDAQIQDVQTRLLKRTAIPSQANPSELDVRALERETLKARYRDLLMKKEHVIISTGMERRQIGEQFKILDRARVPEVPVSPDRARLTLLGAVIGFCLGLAMMMAGRHRSMRGPNQALAQP